MILLRTFPPGPAHMFAVFLSKRETEKHLLTPFFKKKTGGEKNMRRE
jgi:hypothetical protein